MVCIRRRTLRHAVIDMFWSSRLVGSGKPKIVDGLLRGRHGWGLRCETPREVIGKMGRSAAFQDGVGVSSYNERGSVLLGAFGDSDGARRTEFFWFWR
jgi:hypothetical protein